MEHNPQEQHSVKDAVLAHIRSRKQSMRPRIYFIAKLAALVVVSIGVLAVSTFIVNFILFSVRINAQDSLLAFGPRGIGAFVHLFPWPLLVLDIVLVVLLEWILRQFRFGYKSPVLYLIIAICIVTFSLGLLIDRATDFNENLLHHADQHHFGEPFDEFVEGARLPPPPESGVCKCTVTSIQGNVLQVQDVYPNLTKEYTITLQPNDPILGTLHIGDTIFVAGKVASNTIQAFGIHRVPPDPWHQP